MIGAIKKIKQEDAIEKGRVGKQQKYISRSKIWASTMEKTDIQPRAAASRLRKQHVHKALEEES